MADAIPTLDTVHPHTWRQVRDALEMAERAVEAAPRGTPERRAASREASALARRWRQMLDDVRAARIAAGWAPSSALSWVRR